MQRGKQNAKSKEAAENGEEVSSDGEEVSKDPDSDDDLRDDDEELFASEVEEEEDDSNSRSHKSARLLILMIWEKNRNRFVYLNQPIIKTKFTIVNPVHFVNIAKPRCNFLFKHFLHTKCGM